MENQHVKQLLEENYELPIGAYISEGWDIFGKQTGNFVAFTLLAIVISGTAQSIPFIGPVVDSLFISPILWVGMAIFAHKIVNEKAIDFSDFLEGYKDWQQIALAALVTGLIVLASIVPFLIVNLSYIGWEYFTDNTIFEEMITDGDFSAFSNFPFWSFILLLPAIFLSVAYSWTYYFIVFFKLSFWDAMEASRIMITKQWGLFFVFSFVTGLIAVLGVLGLCIGLLFTVPAFYCMHYAAFADITRLNEMQDPEMDITDHFID